MPSGCLQSRPNTASRDLCSACRETSMARKVHAPKRPARLPATSTSCRRCRILLWDERLTTAEAERMLIGADQTRKRRAEVIDKLAATIILQSALDRLKLDT